MSAFDPKRTLKPYAPSREQEVFGMQVGDLQAGQGNTVVGIEPEDGVGANLRYRGLHVRKVGEAEAAYVENVGHARAGCKVGDGI